MKKISILLCLIFASIYTKGQDVNLLPQFHLLKTDSTFITQANLKRNKKVLVIYFGADCVHCKLYTKELLKHMDVLSQTQILMITWSSLGMIKDFNKELDLAKHPNFIVSTEGNGLELFRFYHVKTTPYTAVYDKNWHLTKKFDTSPVIDSLLTAIKK